MVREEARIKEEDAIARIIEKLSDKVHPLALGAVYRAREQTKTLATRLLESQGMLLAPFTGQLWSRYLHLIAN